MKIRIDKADTIFSYYIRLRDIKCMRCGSQVKLNEKGMPVTHQNSHYFGRGKENTRFDPENCDCLCFACHRKWGSDDKEVYRDFKVKQLGKDGFNRLIIRSNTYCKKDRKLALIKAKILLKTIQED